jgi:hypothetical protein
MTEAVTANLRMAANGVQQTIGPEDGELFASYEALVAQDYDRCHPGDSFEAMKLRARFSKEDQGLLKQWMALAAARSTELTRKQSGTGTARIAA